MSVAAPAYAVSYTAPSVTLLTGKSNKCPGGGSPYTYNLGLTVAIAGPATYRFEVVSVTPVGPQGVEGHTVLAPTSTTMAAGGGTVVVRFSTSNSRSTYTTSVTYRIVRVSDNQVMGTYTTPLGSVQYNPYKTGDIGFC